jgi:peptide/nickel transport system permease protein
MFGIAIYAFQLMAEGFQGHLETRKVKGFQQAKRTKRQEDAVDTSGKFQFLQNRGA